MNYSFGKLPLLVMATIAAAFAADVIPVGGTRDGYPLIIPRPKEVKAAAGSFALPAEFAVAAPEDFDLGPLARAYARHIPGGKVLRAGADRPAACRFELAASGVPESPEGYTLTIVPEGITIKARDVRGLFYGMQSLVWILRNRQGDALKACTIADWPDLAMRGLFFELPRRSPKGTARLCHVIDILGALKYNTILIEFGDNFPFRDSPFTGRKETFSRADVEALMAAAKRNHIELIPKLQIASHTQWMTSHRDWAKLTEGPVRNPWSSLYCLSNPVVQPIIEALVCETADMLKPRYFHLGLDEITNCGFPRCPKCRAAGDPAALVIAHVKPLKKLLDDRGITAIVYQDQFFGNSDPGGLLKLPLRRVPEALGSDIVINSWEYGNHVGPMIGNAIRKRGFEKLLYMSYSDAIGNSWRLPILARRMNAMGNILAYWYSAPATLDMPDRCKVTAYPATVAQANYAWNTGDVAFDSLPFDAAGELMTLLDGDRPDAFRGKAVPVPLAGIRTQEFSGHPQFPRFDAKLAAKAKRIAAADPAKFDLETGSVGVKASVLSGARDDGFSDAPVKIPIGVRASGASFLVSAAAVNTFALPRGNAKLPIGEFKVIYEDDKSAAILLTLRHNLDDWNSVIGGNFSRAVMRGNDCDGARFNFGAIDWRNPRPEKAIREIVFTTRRESGIAPVLLALSLSDPDGTPAGVPAAVTASKTAKTESSAPPERKPFVDFADGLPAGSIVMAPNVKGFRYRVVDDPEGGKMLEFSFESTGEGPARCYIDIPVKLAGTLGSLLFDLQISDFSAIYRADVFWADRTRNRFRGALDYCPELDRRRHPVSLPRVRFSERENGGLEPEAAEYLRINFFLNPGANPCTIRIGRLEFCSRQLPCRVNNCAMVR